jgi:hypothetical protein
MIISLSLTPQLTPSLRLPPKVKPVPRCLWPKLFRRHSRSRWLLYVGFCGMLSLAVSSNMPGVAATNPGLINLTFAALPCRTLSLSTNLCGSLYKPLRLSSLSHSFFVYKLAPNFLRATRQQCLHDSRIGLHSKMSDIACA